MLESEWSKNRTDVVHQSAFIGPASCENIVVNGTDMVKLSAVIDPRSADATDVVTTASHMLTVIRGFVDPSYCSRLIGPRFLSGLVDESASDR